MQERRWVCAASVCVGCVWWHIPIRHRGLSCSGLGLDVPAFPISLMGHKTSACNNCFLTEGKSLLSEVYVT